MRAVTVPRFGAPEVLEVAELADPEPGAGEIRIRVTGATVNPTDLSLRSGAQAAALAALEPPYVPGLELAGVVDRVGPGTDFAPGDLVMAITQPKLTGRGAQAELAVVPADGATPVPDGIELIAAATIPMNGLTAAYALDLLALEPGATLGVSGAAGAVGGYAVELGVARGLRVIAIVAIEDKELAKRLGAEAVVPRGPNAPSEVHEVVPGGVDGFVDAANLGPESFAAIRDGGGYATVKGYRGETERAIAIHSVLVGDYARNRTALDELARLAHEGRLTPRIADTYPPEGAAEAHIRLAAGGTRGRLVIRFA